MHHFLFYTTTENVVAQVLQKRMLVNDLFMKETVIVFVLRYCRFQLIDLIIFNSQQK